MKDRIVWLILTLMCTVLSGPLFAGTLGPDDDPYGGIAHLEALLPGGVYLDFTYFVAGEYELAYFESPTNLGIKCTVIMDPLESGTFSWGFPDNSDDEFMVDCLLDGDGNGDMFDSEGSKAQDFIATISGLVVGGKYQVYVKAFNNGAGYAYTWGLASASENSVWDTDGRDGMNCKNGRWDSDAKGSYLWILGDVVYTATGGNLVFYFGEGSDHTAYDGVYVVDATNNPPPIVDAGPSQAVYAPDDMVTLAGSATDNGPVDPASQGYPGGVDSFYWVKESGPGTVIFDPNNTIYDPNATFGAIGVYKIRLQVSDGYKDANDIVTVVVMPAAEMIGYWPFDGDALDHGDNAVDSHGTLAIPEGGYPYYDADAVFGASSIAIADPLNDPNTNEPNDFPHIDLGAATELDFSINDWTVSAWFKTLQIKGGGDVGKGVIFANGADRDGGHRYALILNENNEGAVDLITDDDADRNIAYGGTGVPMNDEVWHFIVGMRRGNQLRLYTDGVLDDTEGLPDNYDLSGTSAWNSRIGLIDKTSGRGIEKHFDGLIDDVRVYNYALTDGPGGDIETMWNAGPHVATVTAGADFQFYWESTHPAKQLNGVVTDTGAGGYTNSLWTTVGGPPNAVFTNAADPNSTVTFPTAAGVYTLALTVTDPDAINTANPGGTVVDTVVVTAVQPTCAHVTTKLPYDFTGGPGGIPDCYISMADLLYLLTDWAECNDPQDAACTWPF